MKHLFFSLCLFVTVSSISNISAKPVTEQDARSCLRNASAQDAQLLLNLTYFSYLRSAATVAAQEILLEHFKQSWKLWQNFATTRRNPRTALPYPDIKQIDSTFANLAAQADAIINATYIQALNYTIEQNSMISSASVKNYIEAVRTQARAAVAKELVNSLIDLEQALQNVQTMVESIHSKKFIHNMRTLANEIEAAEKNFINDGIDYLMNGLALQSFAQFDKKYLASGNQFFELLADSQDMYAQVWHQLETARAAYYQEIYTTVYAMMVERNFPSSSFLCMLDENGTISADKQEDPLPTVLL